MKSLSHANKSGKTSTKVAVPKVAKVASRAIAETSAVAENVRNSGQVAKVASPVVKNVNNCLQKDLPAPAIAETPSAPVVASVVVAPSFTIVNTRKEPVAPVVVEPVEAPTVAQVAPLASAPTLPAVDAVTAPVALVTELAIASIRLDGGTQSRASLSTTTIAEYSEAMTAGAKFPPVVVFDDGKARWLADGFHRVNASVKVGRERIACEVREGSQRDAVLYSVSANATHGLRRSNADKRHAVELLLADSKWSKKSDRWIADACGVSNVFASKLRAELLTVNSSPARAQLSESDSSPTREGKDGKARKLPKASGEPPADREPAGTTAGSPVLRLVPPEGGDEGFDAGTEAMDIYAFCLGVLKKLRGHDLRPIESVLAQLLGRVQKEMARVANGT